MTEHPHVSFPGTQNPRRLDAQRLISRRPAFNASGRFTPMLAMVSAIVRPMFGAEAARDELVEMSGPKDIAGAPGGHLRARD